MRTKYPRITLAGSAVAVAITALGLAGCGSNPGTITGHGTMTVDFNIANGASDPFGNSTQVVVMNSQGTVIASSTLSLASGHTMGVSYLWENDYRFTVTVPGGLARYGIQVGGTNHGTIWETPAEMTHPALSLDLT